MSRSPYQALELALALLRAPALAAQVRERPLPADVLTLIRIAAGDDATLAKAAAASGEAPQRLVEAALLFLQQALFTDDADSYRLLGVPATASPEILKQHHRWLVRWLHPDRQTDDWQAAYMNHVNQAWQNLRTPERRQHYVNRSRHTRNAFARPTAPSVIGMPQPPPEYGRPARRAVRRLRISPFVVGAAALCAGAALGLQYWQGTIRDVGLAAALEQPAGQDRELPAARPLAPAPLHTATGNPAAPATSPPPTPEAPPTARVVAAPARSPSRPTATPKPITAAGTPSAVDAAPAARRLPPKPPVQIAGHAGATIRPKKAATANTQTTPAIQSGNDKNPASALSRGSSDTASRTATTAAPDARLQPLPARLADAYQRGDLAAFVRLFAPDIQTEHGGYAPTTSAYQVLFASSTRRTLALHDIRWQQLDSDRAIGRGQFERTVHTRSGNASQRTVGTVVLEVITPSDDVPLLAGIRFEDAP